MENTNCPMNFKIRLVEKKEEIDNKPTQLLFELRD